MSSVPLELTAHSSLQDQFRVLTVCTAPETPTTSMLRAPAANVVAASIQRMIQPNAWTARLVTFVLALQPAQCQLTKKSKTVISAPRVTTVLLVLTERLPVLLELTTSTRDQVWNRSAFLARLIGTLTCLASLAAKSAAQRPTLRAAHKLARALERTEISLKALAPACVRSDSSQRTTSLTLILRKTVSRSLLKFAHQIKKLR
jgi:hypothetical protein